MTACTFRFQLTSSCGMRGFRGEIRYRLESHLMNAQAAIECAIDEVGKVDEPSSSVVELAGSDASDSVADLVAKLAACEPRISEVAMRDKWLYLTLAWLYERREALTDPLYRFSMRLRGLRLSRRDGSGHSVHANAGPHPVLARRTDATYHHELQGIRRLAQARYRP